MQPAGPRAWCLLLVLSGAIFLEGADVAMINVALPAIRAELGLSTGLLQCVVAVEGAARSDPAITAAMITGVGVLLAVLVVVEKRSAAPLVPLGVLRSSPLVRANLANLLFGAGYFAFQFVVVLYLQARTGRARGSSRRCSCSASRSRWCTGR